MAWRQNENFQVQAAYISALPTTKLQPEKSFKSIWIKRSSAEFSGVMQGNSRHTFKYDQELAFEWLNNSLIQKTTQMIYYLIMHRQEPHINPRSAKRIMPSGHDHVVEHINLK